MKMNEQSIGVAGFVTGLLVGDSWLRLVEVALLAPVVLLFVAALIYKVHLRYGVRRGRAVLAHEEVVLGIPAAYARYRCKRQA